MSDYSGEENRLKKYAENAASTYGRKSVKYIDALQELGSFYRNNSQWKEAADVFREIVSLKEESFATLCSGSLVIIAFPLLR